MIDAAHVMFAQGIEAVAQIGIVVAGRVIIEDAPDGIGRLGERLDEAIQKRIMATR